MKFEVAQSHIFASEKHPLLMLKLAVKCGVARFIPANFWCHISAVYFSNDSRGEIFRTVPQTCCTYICLHVLPQDEDKWI